MTRAGGRGGGGGGRFVTRAATRGLVKDKRRTSCSCPCARRRGAAVPAQPWPLRLRAPAAAARSPPVPGDGRGGAWARCHRPATAAQPRHTEPEGWRGQAGRWTARIWWPRAGTPPDPGPKGSHDAMAAQGSPRDPRFCHLCRERTSWRAEVGPPRPRLLVPDRRILGTEWG